MSDVREIFVSWAAWLTCACAAALSAFRASELPPGFHLTVAGAQTIGGASVPASHLVYSDGLATVSVFVEAQQVKPPGADATPNAPADPPKTTSSNIQVSPESVASTDSSDSHNQKRRFSPM